MVHMCHLVNVFRSQAILRIWGAPLCKRLFVLGPQFWH